MEEKKAPPKKKGQNPYAINNPLFGDNQVTKQKKPARPILGQKEPKPSHKQTKVSAPAKVPENANAQMQKFANSYKEKKVKQASNRPPNQDPREQFSVRFEQVHGYRRPKALKTNPVYGLAQSFKKPTFAAMQGRAREWFQKFPDFYDQVPQTSIDALALMLQKKLTGKSTYGPRICHNLIYAAEEANDFCPKGACGFLTFQTTAEQKAIPPRHEQNQKHNSIHLKWDEKMKFLMTMLSGPWANGEELLCMICGQTKDSTMDLFLCYRGHEHKDLQKAGYGMVLEVTPEEFEKEALSVISKNMQSAPDGILTGMDTNEIFQETDENNTGNNSQEVGLADVRVEDENVVYHDESSAARVVYNWSADMENFWLSVQALFFPNPVDQTTAEAEAANLQEDDFSEGYDLVAFMETGAINSPLMHSYFDRLQDAIDDVGIPPSPGYAVSCLPSEFLDGLQLVEFFCQGQKAKAFEDKIQQHWTNEAYPQHQFIAVETAKSTWCAYLVDHMKPCISIIHSLPADAERKKKEIEIAQWMLLSFMKSAPEGDPHLYYAWKKRFSMSIDEFVEWESLDNFTEGIKPEYGPVFVAMLALHFTHLGALRNPKFSIAENMKPPDFEILDEHRTRLGWQSRYAVLRVLVDGDKAKIITRKFQRLQVLPETPSQQQEDNKMEEEVGQDPDLGMLGIDTRFDEIVMNMRRFKQESLEQFQRELDPQSSQVDKGQPGGFAVRGEAPDEDFFAHQWLNSLQRTCEDLTLEAPVTSVAREDRETDKILNTIYEKTHPTVLTEWVKVLNEIGPYKETVYHCDPDYLQEFNGEELYGPPCKFREKLAAILDCSCFNRKPEGRSKIPRYFVYPAHYNFEWRVIMVDRELGRVYLYDPLSRLYDSRAHFFVMHFIESARQLTGNQNWSYQVVECPRTFSKYETGTHVAHLMYQMSAQGHPPIDPKYDQSHLSEFQRIMYTLLTFQPDPSPVAELMEIDDQPQNIAPRQWNIFASQSQNFSSQGGSTQSKLYDLKGWGGVRGWCLQWAPNGSRVPPLTQSKFMIQDQSSILQQKSQPAMPEENQVMQAPAQVDPDIDKDTVVEEHQWGAYWKMKCLDMTFFSAPWFIKLSDPDQTLILNLCVAQMQVGWSKEITPQPRMKINPSQISYKTWFHKGTNRQSQFSNALALLSQKEGTTRAWFTELTKLDQMKVLLLMNRFKTEQRKAPKGLAGKDKRKEV